MDSKSIISVKEARELLGSDGVNMSDAQIIEVIQTLDAIAVQTLKDAREKRIKDDAMAMANLIYDIYQDKKSLPDNRGKKE